jgi:hypothetical protein
MWVSLPPYMLVGVDPAWHPHSFLQPIVDIKRPFAFANHIRTAFCRMERPWTL